MANKLQPTAATLALIATTLAVTAIGSDAQTVGEPRARATSTLTATDTARLHLVRSSGSAILEEGHASGTLPGTIKAYINVGATVTASFTIYPSRGGSISGRGSGKLKGRSAEPSFAGTMTITRGTGRYAHARGTGGFYGTLTRSSYAMTVQTTGTLFY